MADLGGGPVVASERLLLASGSEVGLCLAAYEELKAEGIKRGC